jgi:hypothetical protein
MNHFRRTRFQKSGSPSSARHLLAVLLTFPIAMTLAVSRATEGIDPCEEPFIPKQGQLPTSPPNDALVLFDGKQTNLFVNMAGSKSDWPTVDGALVSTANSRRSNHIVSRLHFRDADIHVEFLLPAQGDGNSGVYIQAIYELQILNSLGVEDPRAGDLGGIYGLFKPLVNASRPPGIWQVYDIRYCAPCRGSRGKIVKEGTISAWLNGRQIHDHVKIGEPNSPYSPYRYDTTPYLQNIWQRQQLTMTGPLVLQDHDNAVRFRNVWIRPLDDHACMYEP